MVGVIVEKSLPCRTPISLKHRKRIVRQELKSGDISNRDFGGEKTSLSLSRSIQPVWQPAGGPTHFLEALTGSVGGRDDCDLDCETFTCMGKIGPAKTQQVRYKIIFWGEEGITVCRPFIVGSRTGQPTVINL